MIGQAKLERNNSSTHLRRFVIGLGVIGLLVTSTALLIYSALMVLLVAVGLCCLICWLLLLRSGRDFNVLLLCLLLIGYFQGYVDKVIGDQLPGMIWGLAKYGIIALMCTGLLLRLMQRPAARIAPVMKIWIAVWGMVCLCIAMLMVEAKLVEPLYSPISTVQSFGIGNMVLAILVYFEARSKDLHRWLWIVLWLGVVAALFGMVQRLLGPNNLSHLGISMDVLLSPESMAFLGADTPETGHRNLEAGFRAFSFFDTHHAFSAFLVLSILALQVLRSERSVDVRFYWVGMSMLFAGLAVTFNLTNILSAFIALGFVSFLQRGGSLGAIRRILRSGRVWQTVVVVLLGLMLLFVSSTTFRERISGAFEVRKGASGAGGSLAYRLEGFVGGLEAALDYPLGFGLFLNSTQNWTSPNLNRYVRINGYFQEKNIFFSGDNWFQWLMIQVGLPVFFLYALLFVIPLISGWHWRNQMRKGIFRSTLYSCLALTFIVFVGGISNSPILTFPPSNVIFWAAVGLLVKLPVWNAEYSRVPATRPKALPVIESQEMVRAKTDSMVLSVNPPT